MCQGDTDDDSDPLDGNRKGVWLFCLIRDVPSAPHQIYRRVSEGHKLNPHPNIPPVIEISEGPFPLCIVSPWMPNGNILQYTQMNPSANRLTLVRARRPEI